MPFLAHSLLSWEFGDPLRKGSKDDGPQNCARMAQNFAKIGLIAHEGREKLDELAELSV
jgi:hypothetical protein